MADWPKTRCLRPFNCNITICPKRVRTRFTSGHGPAKRRRHAFGRHRSTNPAASPSADALFYSAYARQAVYISISGTVNPVAMEDDTMPLTTHINGYPRVDAYWSGTDKG